MNKLTIFLEELEYEFICDWSFSEFPQVDDSLSILHICSEEQMRIFEQMPAPRDINNSYPFRSALHFIDNAGFIVRSRLWNRDGLMLFCRQAE